MSRPARAPILWTFGLSILCAAVALLVLLRLGQGQLVPDIRSVAVAGGASVVALLLGRLAHVGMAWLVLIAIATPALVLVPVFKPPVWVFPALFVVVAGFYINGVREQVPLYLSNARTQAVIADLITTDRDREFIDLGCGLGDVVVAVARKHPDCRVIGVETAPLSFALAWGRVRFLGLSNAKVRFQSIWETNVTTADVVYAFLSPAPMRRLNDKLSAEMKPGATFVSNSFAVPGRTPDQTVSVDDARQTQLLIWRM